MKKLNFLLLICIMTFAFSSQAQFGIKLGLNTSASGSYGNSEEGETAKLKTGFQGGIFYKLPVVHKLNLIVELNYEARGTVSKKDYTIAYPVQDPMSGAVIGIGDYAIKQEINSVQSYINIPILAVFGDGRLKYYVGPNFGFLIRGKADFERTVDVSLGGTVVSSSKTNLEDLDWEDYESFKGIFAPTNVPSEDGNFLNPADFGLNVGIMFSVTEDLFVDLRVSQGLSDVTNNHYDSSIYPEADYSFESRDDTDRNFSIQLGVGYQF